MEKYRFDDAYEKVYELENGSYVFCSTYYNAGIEKSMSEKKMIEIMEEREKH